MSEKKQKKSLSSFSILFIILLVIFALSWILNGQTFDPVFVEEGAEPLTQVVRANLSDLVMSPYNGFADAMDISFFVLILGGFLGIVTSTGALDAGIHSLVRGSKGRELSLIVILMILFSFGGTTYGMAEETVAFYGIITTAMVAAGFDSLVAVATICLGAGVGVLGSTVNPFVVQVAVDALNSQGIEVNQTIIMGLGAILWLSSLFVAIYFVTSYAKKVQHDKGSTLLTRDELDDMESFKSASNENLKFTGKHKAVLIVFAITFLIMIISLIPWPKLGIMTFDGWSSFLTGQSLGDWYFAEISMWFFIMGIVIALVYGMSESEIVDSFIAGSADILSVVLIIVVSRSVSVLMTSTHIDMLILDRASKLLTGTPTIVFAMGSYVLYLLLSFLIPSTSGLATVSMPVMGGLAVALGFSPEVMLMIFSAASGVINLFTPTSGVVMGGLQMAKVNYTTWINFVKKPIIVLILLNLIILSVAMMILS